MSLKESRASPLSLCLPQCPLHAGPSLAPRTLMAGHSSSPEGSLRWPWELAGTVMPLLRAAPGWSPGQATLFSHRRLVWPLSSTGREQEAQEVRVNGSNSQNQQLQCPPKPWAQDLLPLLRRGKDLQKGTWQEGKAMVFATLQKLR